MLDLDTSLFYLQFYTILVRISGIYWGGCYQHCFKIARENKDSE